MNMDGKRLFGFVFVNLIILGGHFFLLSNWKSQNIFQNRLASPNHVNTDILQTGSLEKSPNTDQLQSRSLEVEAAAKSNNHTVPIKQAIKPLVFPNFIMYGDSITEFSFSQVGQWGSMLTDKLRRKCDVINRGFAGYNSRWNLIMLPRIFTAEDVRNIVGVTVFLGANDATSPRSINHVPLEEYRVNMKKIIEQLISIGLTKDKIIVIGPPPVNNERWKTRHNDRVTLYSNAVADVAAESGVHFIELYNSMIKDRDWKRYLNDGLHFSEKGAKFLFDRLWRVVFKLTKDLPTIQPLPPKVGKNPEVTLLRG